MISNTLREWPRYSTRTVVSAWRDETIRMPIIIFAAFRIITGIAALLIINVAPASLPSWLNGNPSGETYRLALPNNAPLSALVEPWHRYDTAWQRLADQCIRFNVERIRADADEDATEDLHRTKTQQFE